MIRDFLPASPCRTFAYCICIFVLVLFTCAYRIYSKVSKGVFFLYYRKQPIRALLSIDAYGKNCRQIQISRKEILSIFKKLHRVRQRAFKNDDIGLKVCRERINNGFRENRNVTNEEEIFKLYKTAEDVEMVMRTQLVQLEKVDENTFRMNIREETHKRPNYLFNPDAAVPIERRTRKSRKCEDIKEPKGS